MIAKTCSGQTVLPAEMRAEECMTKGTFFLSFFIVVEIDTERAYFSAVSTSTSVDKMEDFIWSILTEMQETWLKANHKTSLL